MTESEVRSLIAMLDRWIRMRISQQVQPGDGEWEEVEISECKENVAAALLGVTQHDLPESLQFTAPKHTS